MRDFYSIIRDDLLLILISYISYSPSFSLFLFSLLWMFPSGQHSLQGEKKMVSLIRLMYTSFSELVLHKKSYICLSFSAFSCIWYSSWFSRECSNAMMRLRSPGLPSLFFYCCLEILTLMSRSTIVTFFRTPLGIPPPTPSYSLPFRCCSPTIVLFDFTLSLLIIDFS